MSKARKIPRASFQITILDDEDYRLLMSERGGMEAFGVFVSLCLVGRQRLLDRRAHQIEGTDSLRLDNSLEHVLDMARATRKQFDACLSAIKRVADRSGGEPWFYVDENGGIVIRSFFKFNADSNHGGPRPGAGRPINGNQDDSRGNQEAIKTDPSGNQEFQAESSRIPSSSSSSSSSSSISVTNPLPPTGGGVVRMETDSEDDPPTVPMSLRSEIVPNNPDEVRKVCRDLDELVFGWGPCAEKSCEAYPASWVFEAGKIAFESKVSRWSYASKILERFDAQGYPDSAKPRKRAPTKPEPVFEWDVIHRAKPRHRPTAS